ncbi:hypothetical protein [Evansella tamaricis]|uniref:B box-type domain-containing protein n=1 Tax=Evansella tamaricis TaxID=2069301 RepID=A0ABS6JML5_9BACI|nr:hypothetical protein [Evansella tamaricis]MBU9713660.1 hypothetical protein [Evansella tamaricis]
MFIPCQSCNTEHATDWLWFVCDTCGYRVCHPCKASIGFKCEQCTFGYFKEK